MLFLARSIVILLFFCFTALAILYLAAASKTREGVSFSGFKKFCSRLPALINTGKSGTRNKSANDDWGENNDCNNDCGQIKSSHEYDNLQRELNRVKAHNEELTTLLQKKEYDLNVKEKEWATNYKKLEVEKSKLQSTNNELTSKILKLTAITGKLHPVSEYEVAIPFCHFFEELNGILNRAIISTLNLSTNSYSELQISDFLTLIDIEEESLSADPVRWYTLLKSAPALTMVAAKDIVTKSPDEQLLYLKKHLFLEYLRPKISQTLLFLDKSRIHLIQIKAPTSDIDSIIEDFVGTLSTYGMSIVHYNTYDILSTERYDLLEIKNIETTHEKCEADNTILSILRYGVNANFLGENDDKTILEMKI